MARPAKTNRWLRTWRERRHHVTDFGDHGTAFGLDLSLSQFPRDEARSHAGQETPETAPRRSWLARMRQRTGSRTA